jgi:cation diffusion facilitator CzcD-associated flavoprotein CzcO
MSTSSCHVAVIGAGPYGLSAAAHLRAAGVEVCVFGEPMEFWRNCMPSGMLLRSAWSASHISDPHAQFTLDHYQAAHGAITTPVPLHRFVEYATWFQRNTVPDVQVTKVTAVEPAPGGFQISLINGEKLRAHRVLVATGLAGFASRPEQFCHIPEHLVSHSSEHADLRHFAGREVIVIGGGQSAIESAVLLHEAGAQVEVISRATSIHWLTRREKLHKLPAFVKKLLFAPSDVGPPGLNQLVHRPDLFKQLPRNLMDRFAYRAIRPAAAGWLVDRAQGVRITSGRTVVEARVSGRCLQLTLDDGTTRSADHVVLATGYKVDVALYRFLSPRLLGPVRRIEGYPELRVGLESSVPGLHFLGAPAAWSFGPLMRFVAGTAYASRAVSARILAADRTSLSKPGLAWVPIPQSRQAS